MTDVLQDPKLYSKFRSYSSKDARENLPAFVDAVVDSGRPVVIKKLHLGRAALIPARDLWIYEVIEALQMDRESVNKPVDVLMQEVYQRSKRYVESRAGDSSDGAGKAGSGE